MNTLPSPSADHSGLSEDRLREYAYFRWIDLGCPHGEDQAHWFWARQHLGALEGGTDHAPASAAPKAGRFSIQDAISANVSDPTHRFHDRGTARDARLDVVAGEARQRVRGRHFDSSLRAPLKLRKP